jgi:ectoine hydrolase
MTLFARDEYLRRINATKQLMQRHGVDVLVVTSPENICYLTGYEGWSFYTPQAALVTLGDEEPTFVTRSMDVACAEFTAFLRPEHVIGFPETYVGRNDRQPMTFIGELLIARGCGSMRIGVEKGVHFFSVHSYEALCAALPNATIVDADLLVDRVRLIKCPQEIEIMRHAGRIATATMQAGINAIEVGVRECDVAAELHAAQLRGTAEGGGGVPVSVLMGVGKKARAPHLKWTDAKLPNDTSVFMELSGCRHQYHVALSRTIRLGVPPAGLTQLCDVVIDAMEETLASIRPGKHCEDVAKVYQQLIKRAGYQKSSRIGYAMGLCFEPTWIERTASLQDGDLTELEPNMTFHMICGMWEGEHQAVMSESFRVSDTGHELLAQLPRRLFVKP